MPFYSINTGAPNSITTDDSKEDKALMAAASPRGSAMIGGSPSSAAAAGGGAGGSNSPTSPRNAEVKSPGGGLGGISEDGSGGGGGDDESDNSATAFVEPSNVADLIMTNLNTLLSSMLQTDPSPECLLAILRRLEEALNNRNSITRSRVAASYLVALKKFVPKLSHEKVAQKEKSLADIGALLSRMFPRVNDAVEATRQTAVENVQALLYIDQLLSNPDNPKPKQEIKLISNVRAGLDNTSNLSLEARLPVLDELVGLVCAVLSNSPPELVRLARTLVEGLVDPDPAGALGVGQMLTSLMKRIAASHLKNDAKDITRLFVDTLVRVNKPDVRAAALVAFRELTKAHFDTVTDVLLKSPSPLPAEVQECFVALVDPEEQEVFVKTLEKLYKTINDTPIEQKTATPLVMAATNALGAVVSRPDIAKPLRSFYAQLLCTLLMRVGTAFGCGDGSVSSHQAIRALRNFFDAMEEKEIIGLCQKEGAWEMMNSPSYDDAITILTKGVCYLTVWCCIAMHACVRVHACADLTCLCWRCGGESAMLRTPFGWLRTRVEK